MPQTRKILTDTQVEAYRRAGFLLPLPALSCRARGLRGAARTSMCTASGRILARFGTFAADP
jgi:hypothetical protein